jgi:cysteinyl-tRNA synthetase
MMHDTTGGPETLHPSDRWPLPPQEIPACSTLTLAGGPLALVGRLRVYTCGITPYDVTHLGHAAVFVWADLLQSMARLAGVDTVMCRNVTDVDDVLSAAAQEKGRYSDELAATQEFYFDRDMKALGVRTPEARPRAHAHVPQVVQLAAALLGSGAAYEDRGYVFFGGDDLPARHRLSVDQALELSAAFGDQAPEVTSEGRRHPLDVAVWRPSAAGEPAWPSPWGWGRPGWHAQCAAMAATVFGSSVDVLVGGAELAFPHHACQAAMLESVTGVRPFARSRMPIGTVMHAGSKMAKSTRNLVLVRDLLRDASGAAVRLMLLHRGWQQAWEYDDRALADAEALLERLRTAAGRNTDGPAAVHAVKAALLADLDVPAAVAIAESEGGTPARFLLEILKLADQAPG